MEIAAFVEPVIDDWGDVEDLQLLLSPPWDTTAQDLLESMLFTSQFIAISVISLIIGVTACVLSLGYYERAAEWAPGRVICATQALINVLQAAVFVSGGPLKSTVFPTNISNVLYSIYSVATTASTLLLVVSGTIHAVGCSTRYGTILKPAS